MWRLVLVCGFAIGAAAQSLSIRTGSVPGTPGLAVAPGALIRAVPQLLHPTDAASVKLQLQPRNATQTYQATVLSADPSGIWAVVPTGIPMGWHTATLIFGGSSETGSVYLARSSFGLFSIIRDGSGPAIAQQVDGRGAPARNQLTQPALPSQYVTLWGTGIGDFGAADVTIDVAGIPARPSFAGHAPGQPGVDQVNFQLPAATPRSCYVPVTVTVAGADVSNTVTLSTSDAADAACAHPLGLSADQLKALDSGGTTTLGGLDISDGGNAYAWLQFADSRSVFTTAGPLMPDLISPTCQLLGLLTFAIDLADPPDVVVYRDAGSALTLDGPGQKSLILPKVTGWYTNRRADGTGAVPSLFFSAGSWTLTGPGGTDVGAFQRTFTIPAPVRWTNRASIGAIDRSSDLTVTWDPQSYGPGDTMDVQVLSYPPSPTLPAGLSAGVRCQVAATAGKAVIPTASLQKIVPTLTDYQSDLTLTLRSGERRLNLFTVPLKAGDIAPVKDTYRSSDSTPVTIR